MQFGGPPSLAQKSGQCSPPRGPAQVAVSGQAARSPGCAVLDLLRLPAGAARWPLGVARGAGQRPCGGQCSRGPGRARRGLTGTQTQAPGPRTWSLPHLYLIHPLHPPPSTPLCGTRSFHSLGISLPTPTAHRVRTATLGFYLRLPAHLRLSYLHINKGPQVAPRQSQEQLNQRGVGSLDGQV